eukprot:jgi/Botrbrau1/6316/Bobra.0339s0026.1
MGSNDRTTSGTGVGSSENSGSPTPTGTDGVSTSGTSSIPRASSKRAGNDRGEGAPLPKRPKSCSGDAELQAISALNLMSKGWHKRGDQPHGSHDSDRRVKKHRSTTSGDKEGETKNLQASDKSPPVAPGRASKADQRMPSSAFHRLAPTMRSTKSPLSPAPRAELDMTYESQARQSAFTPVRGALEATSQSPHQLKPSRPHVTTAHATSSNAQNLPTARALTPPYTDAHIPGAASPDRPPTAPAAPIPAASEPQLEKLTDSRNAGRESSSRSSGGLDQGVSGPPGDEAPGGSRSSDSPRGPLHGEGWQSQPAVPDVAPPEVMSMSLTGPPRGPLSPHGSLRNLSPHSSLRTLPGSYSVKVGMLGPSEHPRQRSNHLEHFNQLLSLRDPNTISGDALQGALEYANLVQISATPETLNTMMEKQTMAAVVNEAMKQAWQLREALKLWRGALDEGAGATSLTQGEGLRRRDMGPVLARVEESMSATRRAMDGLSQVELTAAGCLENSIEQLETLNKYAEAQASSLRHKESLQQNGSQRSRILQGMLRPLEGEALVEQFEELRGNIVDHLEHRSYASAAQAALESTYNTLVQAGTRTLTPQRLTEGKIPMVVERDLLHQYTLLRLVQNIQTLVRNLVSRTDFHDLTRFPPTEEVNAMVQRPQKELLDTAVVNDGAISTPRQMYECLSAIGNDLGKVVGQSSLPEALTAGVAIQHFQAALLLVPKSVRNHMQAFAAYCRRQGLLVKMPSAPIRGLGGPLPTYRSAISSSMHPPRPLGIAPPPLIRGMSSAPAAMSDGQRGPHGDNAAFGPPRNIAGAPSIPSYPPLVRPTALKPSPQGLKPLVEGHRSLGQLGLWNVTGGAVAGESDSPFEKMRWKAPPWSLPFTNEGSRTVPSWGAISETHDSNTHISNLGLNGFETQTSYTSGQPIAADRTGSQTLAQADARRQPPLTAGFHAGQQLPPALPDGMLPSDYLQQQLAQASAAAAAAGGRGPPSDAAAVHDSLQQLLHMMKRGIIPPDRPENMSGMTAVPPSSIPTVTWPGAPVGTPAGTGFRPQGPNLPRWQSAKEPLMANRPVPLAGPMVSLDAGNPSAFYHLAPR